MLNFDSYPTLRKCVNLIALDNGCINRSTSETKVLSNVGLALNKEFSPEQLQDVEGYLAALKLDELSELCCGAQEFEPTEERGILTYKVLESAFNSLL